MSKAFVFISILLAVAASDQDDGGELEDKHPFRWLAQVTYLQPNGTEKICLGTLVGPVRELKAF